MIRVYNGFRFVVFSEGNGARVLIRRVKDGAEVFLQGQDAADFMDQFSDCNWPETLCAEFEPVMGKRA